MQHQLSTLKCLKSFPDQQDAIQYRLDQIIESDENKRKALDQLARSHNKMKSAFDKHTKIKTFKHGDLVVLWDKRREKLGMHNVAIEIARSCCSVI